MGREEFFDQLAASFSNSKCFVRCWLWNKNFTHKKRWQRYGEWKERRGTRLKQIVQETNMNDGNTWNTNECETNRRKTHRIYIYNQAFLFMLQKIREIVLWLFLFYLKWMAKKCVLFSCFLCIFLTLLSSHDNSMFCAHILRIHIRKKMPFSIFSLLAKWISSLSY